MSYKSTIALVNQLGMDHDKKILDWKSQLETKLSNSQVSFGILKYCINNILHVYIAGNFHRYNFCVCVRIIHKKQYGLQQDTLGTTKSVLYKEVSLFQRLIYT